MDWKEKLKELKRGITGSKSDSPTDRQQSTAAASALRESPQHAQTSRDLCLGLDFGTSSTKAVVRLLPTGPAFAIPFAGIASTDQPYLAPTRLGVHGTGTLTLSNPQGGGWVEDLKVRLMEAPWEACPVYDGATILARPADLGACYLALILQKALSWCDQNVKPRLGAANIRWQMNLGIPARDFGATSIREGFLVAALAGWQLAVENAPIDLARAAKAVDAARIDSFQPTGMVRAMMDVIPEVAAGVTTYARSPQRRAGPHLFVDVGATTFDTSMFLLNQSQDELKYVFLSADVDTGLGALRLHRHRATGLGDLALARFVTSDPLRPIPVTAGDCVPPMNEIDSLDTTFSERCVLRVGKVVWEAKMKAPAELSVPDNRHVDPIQVLLSGGGLRLPLYQEVVRESGRRAAPGGKQGLLVRPFQEIPIPQPDDLLPKELSVAVWQRIAIAYGLSYTSGDIGRFVPPFAVKTPPPMPQRDREKSFVGKDQV